MAYNLIAAIGTITTAHSISNPCNIMTLDNMVMLCDDITLTAAYQANRVLLTLSDNDMAPLTDVTLPICVSDGTQTEITTMTVHSNATISIGKTCSSGMVIHLNGICWHANSKYYTPSIGNIYNNGTSPLGVK